MAEMEAENGNLRGQVSTHASEARKARLATMSAEERALVSAQEANDGTIASLTSSLDSIEAEIARLADEPGNGAAIAKLNRQMASDTARLQTEEGRKTYLENQRAQFASQAEAAAAEPADGDKLANGTPLANLHPSSQDWIRRHPKAMTDSRYCGKMVAAAIEAEQAEGLKVNSPEYFAFVEKKLGDAPVANADQDDEQDEEGDEVELDPLDKYEPERPQTRAAGPGSMSAAPPSQAALRQTNAGGNRRAPALSAAEKEAADGLYGSIKNPAERYVKYAQNRDYMNGREPGHFMPRN